MEFSFILRDNILFNENQEEIELQEIIEEYKEKSLIFKDYLKYGYENFVLVRLFHGYQFYLLYQDMKLNKFYYISNLIKAVSLNKIKNTDFKFLYNDNFGELENINNYLYKLFEMNNINIDEIFGTNKILQNINLTPGLYRKMKYDNYNLYNNILNIYLNLTNNIPTINTLLICNKDTTIEEISSFLYRFILCDLPIVFMITNIETLTLDQKKIMVQLLENMYESKKEKIKSFLIFIYQKDDSYFTDFIEKFIPENHILDNLFLKKYDKKNEILDKIIVYYSKYSGYGKTREIMDKIKEKKGKSFQLSIGGNEFSEDFFIDYLKERNFHLDEENYLYINLYETDKSYLMNELLFKMTILKCINTKTDIFYFGYDSNIS